VEIKPPLDIVRATCGAARGKSGWSVFQLLLLGFLAGCYIGFGGFLFTLVTQDAAHFVGLGIAKLLGGICFSLGLLLVIVAGAELFTGNCLMPLGVLSGCISPAAVMRNWFWVYAANLLGSLVFALLIFESGLASGPVGANALRIAAAKANLTFGQAFVRGILCNWLVVLAVWMAASASDLTGKTCAVLFPVTAFVASGFEHSVANMYFLALGILLKADSDTVALSGVPADGLTRLDVWGYWGNIVPVTLGNIVGAVLFVVTIYFLVFRERLAREGE
jgi:formate/nitrite transporter